MSTSKAKTLTLSAAAPIALALLAKAPDAVDKLAKAAATISHGPSSAVAAAPSAASQPVAAPVRLSVAAPSAACVARYGAIGFPSGGDTARRVILCHQNYAVGYDPANRDPDWVIERLQPSELTGPASRSNNFGHDPSLPQGVDATDADYLKSGFDRGHQAPAGDSKFDQKVMDESFYFTNMAPQVGIGFNRGAWKFLEETVRAWVSCGGHSDLYVMTGPIYSGAHPAVIGVDKVVVPVKFYKIVYDANSQRAVGFVLPNIKIGSRIDDLQLYVAPIADIEKDTGLTFFPALDPRQQTQLKTQAGAAWGHAAGCTADTGN